jgi:hypothetical protein
MAQSANNFKKMVGVKTTPMSTNKKLFTGKQGGAAMKRVAKGVKSCK